MKPGSCRDYQEIKVQELIQNLGVGTIPRCMWVVLENDLVDTCKPGDDVTICGIVLRRWKMVKVDVSNSCLQRHLSFQAIILSMLGGESFFQIILICCSIGLGKYKQTYIHYVC